MTPKQVTRATMLLEALKGIPNVRAGLKEKTQAGCPMLFGLQAYEEEGEEGGCGHGDTLLPKEWAEEFLALAEKKIRAELSELGVTP
jgi:hypothetical protein